MKETTISVWCDACYFDQNTKTEGTTHTVKIDTERIMTLELCDKHDAELLDPLRLLLMNQGVPVTKGPPKAIKSPDNSECPLCGITLGRHSLPSHVYTVHGGLNFNEGAKRPVSVGPCPECGAKVGKPEHMGRHRFKAHGITALDTALEYVNKNGLVR